MKKIVLAMAVMLASGVAFAQQGPPSTPPGQADLEDRLNGVYTFECKGYRTDGGLAEDWSLNKVNMDYLTYGITSHVVIDALNKMYLNLGDTAIKAYGDPRGLPVPGVNQ